MRQLIELGVSDFILSPGSRNAPLAIAVHEAVEQGFANLHVRLDERGAAFFALGISKASKKYTVVMCTSGTAAANYHPAALEALHSQVDLLFLTADRPAKVRHTGANQTTIQSGLLAPLSTIDTSVEVDLSKILTGGPIHLNLQFEEPLLETNLDGQKNWLADLSSNSVSRGESVKETLHLGSDGVLIVGHDLAGFAAEAIREFADILDWPVIAEDPLSFPDAIPHASIFLADELIRESLLPQQVVIVGRTTLSRSTNSFIAAIDEQYVIDPRVKGVDVERTATQIFTHLPHVIKHSTSNEWLELWTKVGVLSVSAVNELPWSEQLALRLIAANVPDGSALFIGSSRPVRDIEGFAIPRDGIQIFANRGLAGIDGNIATAFGIASCFKRSFAILGDLTFLHDISALVNQSTDNLTIFLIDNNGGGIFSTLPQASVKGFESLFGTPHNLNLEKLISGFGISVERVKNQSEITDAIAAKRTGLHCVVVEVPTRESNAKLLAQLYQRVAKAVRIGANLA